MIKLIIKILAIFLAVILQVTLMPIFSIKGNFPNLILLAALILVLADFKTDAIIVAAIGGLLFDFFSPLRFGLNTIIFISFVLLLGVVSKRYFPAINLFIIALVVFLSTIIYGLLMSLFLQRWLSWEILIESLYACILGLIFFFVLDHFQKSSRLLKVES